MIRAAQWQRARDRLNQPAEPARCCGDAGGQRHAMRIIGRMAAISRTLDAVPAAGSTGQGDRDPRSHVYDCAVVGGGMSGLGAAADLRARARSVIVIEAGPGVGGLARALRIGGEPIEAYYHHIFPQDRETRDLISLLRLDEHLEWRSASMGMLHHGHAYPFNGPLDVLRFSPLSPWQRLRLGGGTAAQLVRRDHRRLDRRSVDQDGPLMFGRRAYEMIWRPLLDAKFGEAAGRLPMAWLVARLRQRAGARSVNGDRLGYLRGSLGTLVEAYAAHVAVIGVEIRVATRVTSLRHDGEVWLVETERDGVLSVIRARSVVACLSGQILGRLVALPPPYGPAIASIGYRGIVCSLVELSRPLSRYYWVNVTDRLGLGCVAIIEHTNFIPAERYGGSHLVYLAHYVDRGSPAWTATADDLLAAVEPAMRHLNPEYDRSWVKAMHVSRDPFAQPIPQISGPMPGLPVETGLPGLVHASLAHIYPDDRGVSLAVRLGRRAALAAETYLRAAGSRGTAAGDLRPGDH